MTRKLFKWKCKSMSDYTKKNTQALDKTSFTVVVQTKGENADNNKQSSLTSRCLLIPNEKG